MENTVGTRNKEHVGKHIIVPHCEFFPYCESSSVKVSINIPLLRVFILLESLLLRIPTVYHKK